MYVNTVILVGRLAEHPSRWSVPAGGDVVSWRLIVDRPREGGGRRTVDTIRCATFDRRIGERTAAWRPGDLIGVRGALRRRFWRHDATRLGRYEVEVHDAEPVEFAFPVDSRPLSPTGPSP
jgi:single-strand DNA-binding protein